MGRKKFSFLAIILSLCLVGCNSAAKNIKGLSLKKTDDYILITSEETYKSFVIFGDSETFNPILIEQGKPYGIFESINSMLIPDYQWDSFDYAYNTIAVFYIRRIVEKGKSLDIAYSNFSFDENEKKVEFDYFETNYFKSNKKQIVYDLIYVINLDNQFFKNYGRGCYEYSLTNITK